MIPWNWPWLTIFIPDIGNLVYQELQTTKCPQLLHIFQHMPGCGYLPLYSLWVDFRAFSKPWIHCMQCDKYLDQDLRGISDLLRSLSLYSFLLSDTVCLGTLVSLDSSLYLLNSGRLLCFAWDWSPSLPALQPGNSKLWAAAIQALLYVSTLLLITLLPGFQCLKSTFHTFCSDF